MPTRKNVLLIHTDQQRYDSLGCTGNASAVTPNLDRLAAEGCVFDRHISSNPVCMPSRATLMTGLYPTAHGVYSNGVPLNRREYMDFAENQSGVYKEPPTAADVFAAAGYDTVGFGKFHLTPSLGHPKYRFPETASRWMTDDMRDWHGPYYGFRRVEMIKGHAEQPCSTGQYAYWLKDNHPDVLQQVLDLEGQKRRPMEERKDLYPTPVPYALHNTKWLADRTCEYLEERDPDTPFFAFVGFPDPHHAFCPCCDVVPGFEGKPVGERYDPEGEALRAHPLYRELFGNREITHLSMEERALFWQYTDAMVHQIDRGVGQILDCLKAQGLYDDTIIIFTSDHGDYLGDHGLITKGNAPVRSLVHIPFLLRAPGTDLPARTAAPMSNADVLPTLCALCGVTPPDYQHGRDILPVARGESPHEAMVQCQGQSPRTNSFSLCDERYRFTLFPESGYMELYDHENDPGECINLATDPAHRQRAADMRHRVEANTLRCLNPNLARYSMW